MNISVPEAKAAPAAQGSQQNQQQQQQQQGEQKVDTAETRQYTQKHRLWTLGEILSFALMTKRPKDPIGEILATLEKEKEKRTEQVDAPAPEVVAESKSYVQELRVAFLFEDWFKAILEARPEDPVEFSLTFFKKVQDGQSKNQQQQQAGGATASAQN